VSAILCGHRWQHLFKAVLQNRHWNEHAPRELVRLPLEVTVLAMVLVQPVQQMLIGANFRSFEGPTMQE
jgi:hypothetical protein